MSTEERLTALESDRTILNRIASEQLLRLRDLEHNVTILLGVQGSQGQDIKSIKAHLERMESHIDERFDAIMAILSKMQPPQGQ